MVEKSFILTSPEHNTSKIKYRDALIEKNNLNANVTRKCT